MLGIEANWKRREEADKNIEWARRLHKAMRPYSRDGIYLNFPGFMEDRDTLLRSAYGPNLARLRAVKAHHDPTGLFSGLLNMGAGTGFGALERS
jgi:FAD/FMN-containing dehydrogenase